MDTPQKLAQANIYKTAGNKAFSEQKYDEAMRNYHFANNYVSGLDSKDLNKLVNKEDLSIEIQAEIKTLIVSLHSNMAACHIKREHWAKAVVSCDKDPENGKALFRRGQANLALNNLQKAEADTRAAIAISPNDLGIRKQYDEILAIKLVYNEKQKKELAGLFDRKITL